MIHPIIDEDIKLVTKELGASIHQLEGKSVLITGASGMLASYIVYTLMYANLKIFKKPVQLYLVIRGNKKKFGVDKNIHYLKIDISKQVPNQKGFHYIIHAASKASSKIYMDNMIDTLNSNILGLYNVIKASDKKLKSLLFFSTGEIYGNPNTNQLINEDYIGSIDHLNSRSCYVEGKRACETICMNYFWENKLPVKIARIFHTSGPGMNLDDGKFFSDFIKFGLEKKNIAILGNKNLERSILYIKDATIMLLKLLLSDHNGQVFNIANPNNNLSIEKIAQKICNYFNIKYEKKLNVTFNKKNNIPYYKYAVKTINPSIDKYKKKFSYMPNTGIDEMIERVINYYLSISI